jgi:hypothetical protein
VHSTALPLFLCDPVVDYKEFRNPLRKKINKPYFKDYLNGLKYQLPPCDKALKLIN